MKVSQLEGERERERGNMGTGFDFAGFEHKSHDAQTTPGRVYCETEIQKFKIKIKILLINEPGLRSCGSNKINTQLMPNADKR